jgi:hypothetical protein
VKVEYFISEKIYKLNILRFWVKVWCWTHLYYCFGPNMDDRSNCPLMIQQWYKGRYFDEGFNRLVVSKVFLTNIVRQRVLLSATNGYNYEKKKFSHEGKHKKLNDSQLRRIWFMASVRWVNCLILLRNVYVEHFISGKTHKSNVL